MVKLGIVRSLLLFGLAQALSNAGYCLLSWVGHSQVLMVVVIGVEYFCAGLVVAGFIAFLMSQCNKRYSATQFALLTSLMAFAGAWAGAPTGYLVKHLGYPGFFLISILCGLPGMVLLAWLPRIGRTR